MMSLSLIIRYLYHSWSSSLVRSAEFKDIVQYNEHRCFLKWNLTVFNNGRRFHQSFLKHTQDWFSYINPNSIIYCRLINHWTHSKKVRTRFSAVNDTKILWEFKAATFCTNLKNEKTYLQVNISYISSVFPI